MLTFLATCSWRDLNATSPKTATGTFSGMEEMENPKLTPWLGPALY